MLFEPVQCRMSRSLQEIPLLIGECRGEQSGKRGKSWQSPWQSLAGEQRLKQEGVAVTPCSAVVFTCYLPQAPLGHTFRRVSRPRRVPRWHLGTPGGTARAQQPRPRRELLLEAASDSRAQKQFAVLLLSLTSALALHWQPNITDLNPNLTSRSAKLLQTASDTPTTDFNSLLSLLFRIRTRCWQSFKSRSNLLYHKYS